ncbi:uncharacterized protein LOC111251776 [Varroa destructor]|uniref:Uncharacterized protein n=1 Tax=Varroa destructor TaxID=109461 RepID=A0A7M7MBN5_VARDE|nr:uncharacterized protein LOC111251776 [Varroa destructor]
MRLLVIVNLFLLLIVAASGQLLEVAGATQGLAALSSSLVSLGRVLLPVGLLKTLALIGPLKLTLPALFGLKALGLLKLKLLLAKAPLLAPLGLSIGKVKLAKAKLGLAKTAASTAANIKLALLELPFKVKAMKIGAIAGAKAGGKTGLFLAQNQPQIQLVDPIVIPASALLSQNRIPDRPSSLLVHPTSSKGYSMSGPEFKEPLYGREPTMTTPLPALAYTLKPPAYTPALPAYTPPPSAYTSEPVPEPAYTPVAYQSHHRLRREAKGATPSAVPEEALRQVFSYVDQYDVDQCILRVVCELAVNPNLDSYPGDDVTKFMLSLNDSNPEEPWTPYKNAAIMGLTHRSREQCQSKFSLCPVETEGLLRLAKIRLEGYDL